MNDNEWSGAATFRDLIEELVTDLGTGLDQSLYTQAVVHCLGRPEVVTRQLPMQLDGLLLGNQRFHLVDSRTAFPITTFQDQLNRRHLHHLRRLMAPSALESLYWMNIARHKLSLHNIEFSCREN